MLTPTNRGAVGRVALAIALLFVGYAIGRADRDARAAVPTFVADEVRVAELVDEQAADRVFELRTYTAADGKYEALLTRFRDHTVALFERHGMENVGYWTPQDAPLAENTLVYLLAHASREAANESWSAFSNDPEWQEVFQASRADGALIANLERVYLDPADFSPMR